MDDILRYMDLLFKIFGTFFVFYDNNFDRPSSPYDISADVGLDTPFDMLTFEVRF